MAGAALHRAGAEFRAAGAALGERGAEFRQMGAAPFPYGGRVPRKGGVPIPRRGGVPGGGGGVPAKGGGSDWLHWSPRRAWAIGLLGRLLHDEAAIDGEDFADDVSGFGAGEEEGGDGAEAGEEAKRLPLPFAFCGSSFQIMASALTMVRRLVCCLLLVQCDASEYAFSN